MRRGWTTEGASASERRGHTGEGEGRWGRESTDEQARARSESVKADSSRTLTNGTSLFSRTSRWMALAKKGRSPLSIRKRRAAPVRWWRSRRWRQGVQVSQDGGRGDNALVAPQCEL